MYLKFYGFKERPFNLTPNSKLFFPSQKHAEALSSLLYAINHRKGFIVITGEIGSGKTTVCRTLLNQLDQHTETALITNTHLNSKDLFMTILEDLGIDFNPNWTKSRLLSSLNEYLIGQLQRGRNVVLIIDEAQNLTPLVLEEVRILSNLETETEKLIQIILIGQPELKNKLALSCLEQLRQRVSVCFHLSALDYSETKEYILHRLKISSGSGREYFTEEALELVYQFSKGVPRLINQICDLAFLSGYVDSAPIIDERIMREVIEESPMQKLSFEKALLLTCK